MLTCPRRCFFYSFIAKKITKIKIFVEIVKLCFAIAKGWNVLCIKTSQHVCQICMYSLLPAFNICSAVTVYIEKQILLIFAVFKITEPFKIQTSCNSSTSNAYAWTAVAFFYSFFVFIKNTLCNRKPVRNSLWFSFCKVNQFVRHFSRSWSGEKKCKLIS